MLGVRDGRVNVILHISTTTQNSINSFDCKALLKGEEYQLELGRRIVEPTAILLTQKQLIYFPTPWEKARKQFLVESNYKGIATCKVIQRK